MLRSPICFELGNERQLRKHHAVDAKVVLQVGQVVKELAMTFTFLCLEEAIDDGGFILG